MNRLTEEALVVPCPKCEAKIDEPCKTKTGKRSTYPHVQRTAPLYAYWRQGYAEGRAMMATLVEQHVEGTRSLESLHDAAHRALQERAV